MTSKSLFRAALLGATALAAATPTFAQDANLGGPAVGPNAGPSSDGSSDGTPASSGIGRSGERRVVVLPYVEIDQVVDTPISGGGETLTFTDVQAGIDASIATRRVQATVNYRYEHQFAETGHYSDQDVNTGVARAEIALVPNAVNLDIGGLATRARNGLGDATPGFYTRDYRGVSQIYALYVGPTASQSFGDLDVSAGYHFGLVHADEGNQGIDLGPGQPSFGSYDTSTSQSVNARIGARPGTLLPFGWTISGGYVREDQHFLDARFQDRFVALSVTQPVSATVALVGDVGYEKLDNSQRQLLVDANGSAVLTAKGHLQGDDSLPRQLSYQQDGLFWDVGLSWRPNQRTSLDARYGRRYGEWIAFGTLSYQTGAASEIQAGVYNDVETFGHQLTNTVGGLPTAFQVNYNPIVGNIDGCVFGTNGGGSGCLGGALQSINGNLFRARGAYAVWSATDGRWTYGAGLNYDERRYLTPVGAIGSAFLYARAKDRSATADINLSRTLSSVSGVDAQLYALWYDSGYTVVDTPSVYSVGATAGYHRLLANRLLGQATVGVYGTGARSIDTSVAASLLVGARYTF